MESNCSYLDESRIKLVVRMVTTHPLEKEPRCRIGFSNILAKWGLYNLQPLFGHRVFEIAIAMDLHYSTPSRYVNHSSRPFR